MVIAAATSLNLTTLITLLISGEMNHGVFLFSRTLSSPFLSLSGYFCIIPCKLNWFLNRLLGSYQSIAASTESQAAGTELQAAKLANALLFYDCGTDQQQSAQAA